MKLHTITTIGLQTTITATTSLDRGRKRRKKRRREEGGKTERRGRRDYDSEKGRRGRKRRGRRRRGRGRRGIKRLRAVGVDAEGVGTDEGRMREGLGRVVGVGIRIIVEEDNGLILLRFAEAVDDVHTVVLEHPQVGREIDLATGIEIGEELGTMDATAMTKRWAETSNSALHILHSIILKERDVDIGRLEDLEALPDSLDTSGCERL
ncbi:MAG: hypothetical protein II951_01600 [Bacteroidales bacterium]|nr:hypothetical protein [Bacteroidales bacterium]